MCDVCTGYVIRRLENRISDPVQYIEEHIDLSDIIEIRIVVNRREKVLYITEHIPPRCPWIIDSLE